MTSSALQSRFVNLKTVIPFTDFVPFIRDHSPQCAILWAVHDESGKVRHTHAVLRFPSVTRWGWLRQWLMENDPHSYSAPARSFVRSCRYLLHLDNPEKEPIPYSSLTYDGIDESEVSLMMGGKSSPILTSLQECRGMEVVDMFQFLVSVKGHKPSEISSAVRCLFDLQQFKERGTNILGKLPEPVFLDNFDEFDFDLPPDL